MITKFDSLFAGHVDLDNVGYGGTPGQRAPLSQRAPGHRVDKAEAWPS